MVIVIPAMQRKTGETEAFLAELENMPRSGTMGFYFPWNPRRGDFESKSFDPRLCDNRLSHEEVSVFLEHIEDISSFKSNYCDWVVAVFFLVFLMIPVLIVVLLLTVGKSSSSTSSSRSRSTSSSSNKGTQIGIVVGVLFGGLALLVWIGCIVKKRAMKSREEFTKDVREVVEYDQTAIFSKKGMTARVSPQGAYISIEFTFRHTRETHDPQGPPRDPRPLDLQAHQQMGATHPVPPMPSVPR